MSEIDKQEEYGRENDLSSFDAKKKSSGLTLPKKLKGDKFTKAILAFALPCLLLIIQLVQGAAKTPTLQYGTFGRSNNALSTHPPPVNDPTRGCKAKNRCRQFTLSLENCRWVK
ncbi:hypothetical protein J1N35_014273 [Gossypium stocksii]|uniref:Uncharacterized protein n=1 Tax=Gossypium stocksii TaxID=47602 RepID=A0A9D3VU01_9ROSI|nr:hypothetical protein J1N35_014273 [Gossypium stocksii]